MPPSSTSRSVSTPRGAKAVATRTRKRENSTDQRKVALDAAVKRAAGRLANVRKEIRALEKEGGGSQAEKLDALRKTEETTRSGSRASSAAPGSSRTGCSPMEPETGSQKRAQKPAAAAVPGRSKEAS